MTAKKLYTAAREARLFAGEAASKAAHCVAIGDETGFDRWMAEAARLARKGGELERQADEMSGLAA